MSVTLDYALKLNVVETLEADVDSAPSPNVNHTAFSKRGTITADTTASPVTLVSMQALTQVNDGTADTFDLRSLTGTNGIAVDGHTLTVQAFLFNNTHATESVVVSEGTATAYQMLGATYSITIPPGASALFFLNNLPSGGEVISATKKHIDLTAAQGTTYEIGVVMG